MESRVDTDPGEPHTMYLYLVYLDVVVRENVVRATVHLRHLLKRGECSSGPRV